MRVFTPGLAKLLLAAAWSLLTNSLGKLLEDWLTLHKAVVWQRINCNHWRPSPAC
jgi:hypothetical protein